MKVKEKGENKNKLMDKNFKLFVELYYELHLTYSLKFVYPNSCLKDKGGLKSF